MRYKIVPAGGGYREYPVPENERICKENTWQIQDGEKIFYLSEETHFFRREENVAISQGTEASLRILGLRSRFYIRGMKLFSEVREGECLYRNRQRIGEGETALRPGDVLFLGELKIKIWEREISVQGFSGKYDASLTEQPEVIYQEGFPVYKRPPRLVKRLCAESITIELPKEAKQQDRKTLLLSLLPSLGMMAVALSAGLLAGRGIYLLTSAAAAGMTAIFSGIRYVWEKREIAEKNRRRRKNYIGYLYGRRKEIAMAYEREQELHAYQYPCLERIAEMVSAYDSRIYERTPLDEDFLTVSLGRYTGKANLVIGGKEPGWDAQEEPFTEMVREIRRRYSVIEKPKAVSLKKAHLGMVGDKEILHRQLWSLAAQVSVFQSYHDLQIIVIYDKEYGNGFSWMRWLPHTRLWPMNISGLVCSERTRDIVLGSISQILKERAEHRKEGKKDANYLPWYLFLVDEPSWIMEHRIMEYLRMDGDALGFSVIYTSYIRANLPEYIGTVLIIENSEEGTLLLEENAYAGQKITLEQAQDVDFGWLARNLGVLRHEKGFASPIPKKVTFFDMYGIERPEELKIRDRWKGSKSHKSLAVPLGMRGAGDLLYLNLHEKAHGPHGLVAGTTGSGKSELIQSYILSLAVNFHPYEAGFLLIDYKGGGMADLFGRLPHHMGTITNLDGNGSMRALVSVKAELSRRQRILRESGVNHIDGYMQMFKDGTVTEPLPHLFLICDEFAELKKEQPDFMKELVSASRIGRSLGVHLILATQKPSGIIDEQIWSNSRFKLCLKVQSEGDSKEVLKTTDAAAVTLPGRAYLKVGNHETYELFQSAFCGAEYTETAKKDGADDRRVYVVNELGQGELVNQDLSCMPGVCRICRTQLEAVALHVREVFEKEGGTEVRKPWLPPLGKMLISPVITKNAGMQWGKAEISVMLGKIDIPQTQEQRELEHYFERDGNLLFTASSGYGKTVFLTTVLVSLGACFDVDDVNFYILDFGNHGCMPMKELPHTAEYIALDDEERYRKFKKLIAEEISARKRLFAEYAASSLAEYQELSGKTMKAVVIAIDQFDVVKETGIEEEEVFTKLTRDGIGLGIYTVATAARVNGIRQATLNNFKNKIAGYQFDENEAYLTVGRVPFKQSDIPGRVLVSAEEVYEAQVYTIAPCENKAAYSKAVKERIRQIRKRFPGKEAPHIPVLPQEFFSSMLEGYPNDGSGYLVGLDVEGVTGKGFGKNAGLFVIIGNAGTGKTNILRVLADQAILKGRTCIFDSRDMELYRYRQDSRVLYMEEREETALFLREMAQELERRQRFMKKRLGECGELSPKKLVCEMPFYTILIDDIDDFAEFMKADLDRAISFIKEGASLGIVCILTVHAAKIRGISGVDRMVKQAANGLVLSSQGAAPLFPVPSMQKLPKFGDGLLFRNGVYQRVRLPKHGRG